MVKMTVTGNNYVCFLFVVRYLIGVQINYFSAIRFNFKADTNLTVDGFFAHEVAEIVPEAVTGEKDAVDENGDMITQTIDHSKLVPLLTAGIQDIVSVVDISTASTSFSSIYIDPSGNIGIGTNDPRTKLDVRGGVRIIAQNYFVLNLRADHPGLKFSDSTT